MDAENISKWMIKNPIEKDKKLKEKITELRLKLMEIGLATKKVVSWNLMKNLVKKKK